LSYLIPHHWLSSNQSNNKITKLLEVAAYCHLQSNIAWSQW
jgi:hypothetical protein